MSLKPQAILLLRLAVDIIDEDKEDAVAVAKELMSIAVGMIPVDQLKQFLSDVDRRATDVEMDVAEAVKLEATK